ncbi:MAG TPA: type I methionyl aminopeptidase [Ktedonobacteraceae bacterium]|nr:type I methionyl aminopeptidase [Ktedonobacteraceae bacterium]
MAVILKSRQEIGHLREAGRLVAETFEVLRPYVVPGTSTAELDKIAEDFLLSRGGKPIYKGYGARPARGGQPAVPPFPATICASVNDVICHGIPNREQKLSEGDIIGVDIGVLYKGWVGDSCVTYPVGKLSEQAQLLMEVTYKCMELGINEARANKRLGDVGAAIQTYAESHGFSVVRELVGHGVGRSLHEDPQVLHYGKPNTGERLRPGMVFIVEPMINVGTFETKTLPDRWTICTKDGKLSAQFEHTLAITDGAPEILTLP